MGPTWASARARARNGVRTKARYTCWCPMRVPAASIGLANPNPNRAPAASRLCSKLKEQPSRKAQRSSRHRSRRSLTSSAARPWRHTRYRGRHVVRSAPSASVPVWRSPGGSSSSSGHGLGLSRQNSRKCSACSAGTMTRLACTKPSASPAVGPPCEPWVQASRTAAGLEARPSHHADSGAVSPFWRLLVAMACALPAAWRRLADSFAARRAQRRNESVVRCRPR